MSQSLGKETASSSAFKLDRRTLLAGTAAAVLSGCGGEDSPLTSLGPKIEKSKPDGGQGNGVGNEVVTVGRFYRAEHGNNLQPAFQAAIDHAAEKGRRKLVNDLGAISAEMWCPQRTLPYDRLGQKVDGIPLIVSKALDLDFAGAQFTLKGLNGGDRMIGQPAAGLSGPWLGGWLQVVGHKDFGRIAVENVTVDGGWSGPMVNTEARNLTDKGFAVQNTEVNEIYMRNVELRNFAAEIYYNAGYGVRHQHIEDCHFHGSPQSAWNGSSNGGKATVIRLRAGRAYIPAEIICGHGHTYTDCHFYDAGGNGGSGGCGFFGGPDPSFRSGYPYWYAHWDGEGERPWTTFENTVFERCHHILIGAWMRGRLKTVDTRVPLQHGVGHLRDVDLEIDSWCDQRNGVEAVVLHGPRDLSTQLSGGPAGVYLEKPSDIRLRVNCRRTDFARSRNYRHPSAIRSYGGLVDASSVSIEVSGEAARAWELHGTAAPGFEMPQIAMNGFAAIG